MPETPQDSCIRELWDGDPIDPAQLRCALVEQLYRQASSALYGAFVASVALAVVLWNVVSHRRLIVWLVCSAGLYIGRYVLVREFLKSRPQGDEIVPWAQRFDVTTAISGVLWGAAAVALFPDDAPLHQAALVILMAGTCSGTVVVYCPRKSAYVPFALLAGLPLAFAFLARGGPIYLMMGFIVLVYVAVMLVTGNRMHAANLESIKLQFANRRLMEGLTEEKLAVEKLNVSLREGIQERRITEEALRESETRYREFLEFLPQVVFECDRQGMITYLNQAGQEAIGYSSEDLLKDLPFLEIIAPDYKEAAEKSMDLLLTGGRTRGNEYVILSKDGTMIPILSYSAPVIAQGKITGIRGIAVDVSDMKKAEQQIRADLEEKDVLLREIHHRVKNNLAVVSSLIGLQSYYAPDELHHRMFEETQARIRSMALAHEKLFQTEGLAALHAGDYLSGLVDELHFASGKVGTVISVVKQMEEVSLGLDTAIPLGFITNELFSNCVKHAFPDRRDGRIHISLRSTHDDEMELAVRDDGVGMPADFDLESSQSLGLVLVKTFAKQLRGEIEIHSAQGTEVVVRFHEKGRTE